MKTTKIKNQYRTLRIDTGNINEDDRTVELSFSSELPVSRYFGQEILDHDPKSVDLSRLNNGAALLEDHKDGQIGVVLGAKIENGRGVAKVKFSRSQRGEEIYQDVLDEIRQNVSFGYVIRSLELEKEEEGKEPVYRSKDWMPFEISIVGTPADPTIGIGRSMEEENEVKVPDSFRTLGDDVEVIEDKEVINEKKSQKYKEQRLKLLSLKINKALSKQ